jgi:hypothetical protein
MSRLVSGTNIKAPSGLYLFRHRDRINGFKRRCRSPTERDEEVRGSAGDCESNINVSVMLVDIFPADNEANLKGTILDLQACLLQTQEDLRSAAHDLYQLRLEHMNCKRELKRERLLHRIAYKFIPENQLCEYALACPSGQQVSVESSPVSVSFICGCNVMRHELI